MTQRVNGSQLSDCYRSEPAQPRSQNRGANASTAHQSTAAPSKQDNFIDNSSADAQRNPWSVPGGARPLKSTFHQRDQSSSSKGMLAGFWVEPGSGQSPRNSENTTLNQEFKGGFFVPPPVRDGVDLRSDNVCGGHMTHHAGGRGPRSERSLAGPDPRRAEPARRSPLLLFTRLPSAVLAGRDVRACVRAGMCSGRV